ncbi:MAG: hypothetical protein V3R29_11330, partial [Candidatus Acidoferrales bacterium]
DTSGAKAPDALADSSAGLKPGPAKNSLSYQMAGQGFSPDSSLASKFSALAAEVSGSQGLQPVLAGKICAGSKSCHTDNSVAEEVFR